MAVPQPPSIPDDATEDVPPEGQVAVTPLTDPEAEHRRGMERNRLKFGMWLIGACLGVFVILSAGQYALQQLLPGTESLTGALDLLKLVATTALGFVFGRSLDQDKEAKHK